MLERPRDHHRAASRCAAGALCVGMGGRGRGPHDFELLPDERVERIQSQRVGF